VRVSRNVRRIHGLRESKILSLADSYAWLAVSCRSISARTCLNSSCRCADFAVHNSSGIASLKRSSLAAPSIAAGGGAWTPDELLLVVLALSEHGGHFAGEFRRDSDGLQDLAELANPFLFADARVPSRSAVPGAVVVDVLALLRLGRERAAASANVTSPANAWRRLVCRGRFAPRRHPALGRRERLGSRAVKGLSSGILCSTSATQYATDLPSTMIRITQERRQQGKRTMADAPEIVTAAASDTSARRRRTRLPEGT
jgi:hypothetical protein